MNQNLVVLQAGEEGKKHGRSPLDYRGICSALDAEAVLEIEPDPKGRALLDPKNRLLNVLENPAITKNIRGAVLDSKELRFWVIVGLILQLFPLVFAAVVTFHWKWLRKGMVIPKFAYGCYATGTLCLTGGLLGCGQVIKISTTDYSVQKNLRGGDMVQRVINLQMDCVVASQHFPSYVILYEPKGDALFRASCLNNVNHEFARPLLMLYFLSRG